MGNYYKNIFSKLRRGDREKKGVYWRLGKGRTHSNKLLAGKLAACLGPIADPALTRSQDLAHGISEGIRILSAYGLAGANRPTPESRADGALWGKELLLTLRFRGFVG